MGEIEKMTKEELEKIREKTCSTCMHFSKDVDTEEPCKSCYRQSYWEIKEK
jgi:hypothetical protein